MPFVDNDSEPWHEPPGHIKAYSKYLVNPDNQETEHFDFRLSTYPPGGYVEAHLHERAEQIYYFIEGSVTVRLGDESRVVGPGETVYVPRTVEHGVVNTSEVDAVFLVITSPPNEVPR